MLADNPRPSNDFEALFRDSARLTGRKSGSYNLLTRAVVPRSPLLAAGILRVAAAPSSFPGASMGSIGMPELVIIFVIALIIFGPRKLPELGKSLGRSINEFKRASNELKSTLEDEIRVEEQRSTTASRATTPAAARLRSPTSRCLARPIRAPRLG